MRKLKRAPAYGPHPRIPSMWHETVQTLRENHKAAKGSTSFAEQLAKAIKQLEKT